MEHLNAVNGMPPDKVLSLPNEQLLLAALHDYVMCEADRHYGNVFVDRATNRLWLIDNDMVGTGVEAGCDAGCGVSNPAVS